MNDPATKPTCLWRKGILYFSAALCVGVALCYWLQPDELAALTLAPIWFWLVPALTLARLGYQRSRRALAGAILLSWLLVVVVGDGELQHLVRFGRLPSEAWSAARRQGKALRVVTLNCRMGSAAAAGEVAGYDPDIVLLQESPGREQVEQLTRQLFGSEGEFLRSSDTSILARGRVVAIPNPQADHFVHAEVTLASGLEAEVVCLRLNPPVSRLDFWSPGFWRDHRDNRIRHRTELQAVMKSLRSPDETTHVIVGGDFNSPAGDGAFEPLVSRLHDTFREGGQGWGKTGTNEFPLFRVDQIWTGWSFRAETVMARKTRHSDHRLVVCDLVVDE